MKQSRNLRVLLAASFLLLFVQVGRATTYHVPEQLSQIQLAIMACSAAGDTIIVAPGRYVENLDYLGKDIVLTSLYQSGGDENIIRETILDGGQNGSVVTFINGETRAAVLNGFTVTNGSGRDEDFLGTRGGGAYIRYSQPSITHCRIEENQCSGVSGGGGIYVSHGNPYFAGLTVTRNVAQSKGGGMFLGHSNLELDSLDRCSVYLNNAAAYCDIYQTRDNDPSPHFYLDTSSVDYEDSYFMGGSVAVEADILHGALTPVPHDLWVSPFGDDENSGQSEVDQLKTIAHALAVIEADSLCHRTIHLAPGSYKPSEGQIFPLNLRSYVSLEGAGRDSTIFDMEFTAVRVFGAIDFKVDCSVKSISVKHLAHGIPEDAFQITQCTNLLLEDLRFTGNSAPYPIVSSAYDWMDINPGTGLVIKDCLFDGNNTVKLIGISLLQYVVVKDCRINANTPVNDFPPDDIQYGVESGLGMYAYLGYETSIDYQHRIENCVFTGNVSTNNGGTRYSPALNIGGYCDHPIDVVGCTFADNSSPHTGGLWLSPRGPNGAKVRLANCLFWGNEPYQIWIDGEYMPPSPPMQVQISHCLIQDGADGVYAFGNTETMFLDGILDADPLFVGEGDEPYRLSADSPAIDVGTAFWVVDGDTVVNLSDDDYAGGAPDIGAYEWIPTSVKDAEIPLRPADFGITSVSPNPFNPVTKIYFHLSSPGRVQLLIYDMLGRQCDRITNAWFAVGDHALQFTADGHTSGVYMAELRTEQGSDWRKLTLVK